MAITPTGSRNLLAALRRAAATTWFGAPSAGIEAPPVALNNEAIRAPNAAGTAYVEMLKVNASDEVEAPTSLKVTGTLSASSAFTPSAGVVATGSPHGIWGANYPPTAATSGTSVQAVANKQWISPVWVPANMTITGLAFLIGTTGAADKAIVALYNNAGVLVANSSVTTSGTAVGTAANLQPVDFTTPYAAVGPARYWASVQISGTTAYFRAIPANVSVAYVGSKTNATAVPATSITAPTSFTADVGPILAVY